MNEHENSGPKHTQIDISNDENLAYWMQLLNCDKEVLLLAIRMVGNNVTKVDAYLSMNRLKNNDWNEQQFVPGIEQSTAQWKSVVEPVLYSEQSKLMQSRVKLAFERVVLVKARCLT